MKKVVALLTKEKEKIAMNEWKNDDSDIFWALYRVYKKWGQFFFDTYYLLTFLNKGISVLLKVINIWTSS